MKYLRITFAGLSAICFIAAIAITCFSATARTPKANGQNKNYWCWATSAKVVTENNGGSWISSSAVVLTDTTGVHSYNGTPYYGVNSNGNYTADGVQHAIVYYVFGNDGNNSVSDSNKESALRYAANSSVSVGTFGTYNTTLSTSQIQDVKDDLDDGNYVIGNLYASGFGAHSVVIKKLYFIHR